MLEVLSTKNTKGDVKMKKIATFAVLALFAVSANALTLTSPFFMQKESKILSSTELDYTNLREGATLYKLTEKVSYGIADNIQVGAFIGYGLGHEAGENYKGFYNPGLFGYYRILNDNFNLDAGAEITFGLFDNDIETKDYRYDVVVRAEKNVDEFSFGGKTTFALWNPKDSDNTKNVLLYAYALYNFNEKLSAGFDLGYNFYDIGEDYDSKEYSVRAIGGYEFEENMGLFGYAGFKKSDKDGKEVQPVVGAHFKVLF
jgi:hypothetical protein